MLFYVILLVIVILSCLPNHKPQRDTGKLESRKLTYQRPHIKGELKRKQPPLVSKQEVPLEQEKPSVPKSPKYIYTYSERQAYQRAFEMRCNPTRAERKFKSVLSGYCSFKEQYVIWRDKDHQYYYIVDFLDMQNHIVFEVDGGYHSTEEQRIKDERRTKDLKRMGYSVVRISNDDVLKGKSHLLLNEIYRKNDMDDPFKE